MKISFSLRAFIVYFLILGTLSWFILDKAIERLNIALRQSAESVLVDTANLLATSLEHEFKDGSLDTWEIQRLFNDAYQRQTGAKIYNIVKDEVDTEVYVTDAKGMVVYDSLGEKVGEDYSRWRDVKLTLQGEYGARTSFRYEDQTEEDDPKIMVIAAPIRFNGNIAGVVSVVKPIDVLEAFLLDESNLLKRYAIGLLAIAMVLGYLVSHTFTASTTKLARYADDMALGKRVPRPKFMDKRFSNLSKSIFRLRKQLDGKDYVENYVHSLTHELKTPITAMQGALEILEGDIPEQERQRFLDNMRQSQIRMSSLVDRMLTLARLEGRPQLSAFQDYDLLQAVKELIEERYALLEEKQLSVEISSNNEFRVKVEPLLLQQALANLLDNAIKYSPNGSEILVRFAAQDEQNIVEVINQGPALESYVTEQAFDRFFSRPSEEGGRKSTGLGLSFVREIMQLHLGEASLTNSEQGITARLRWPQNILS